MKTFKQITEAYISSPEEDTWRKISSNVWRRNMRSDAMTIVGYFTITRSNGKYVLRKHDPSAKGFESAMIAKFDKIMDAKNFVEGPKQFEEQVTPMPMEAKYNYSVYKLDVKGKKSHRENLNFDEVQEFIDSKLGKWASIFVVRSDGNAVTYTDNGKKFVAIKKEKLSKGDKLVP